MAIAKVITKCRDEKYWWSLVGKDRKTNHQTVRPTLLDGVYLVFETPSFGNIFPFITLIRSLHFENFSFTFRRHWKKSVFFSLLYRIVLTSILEKSTRLTKSIAMFVHNVGISRLCLTLLHPWVALQIVKNRYVHSNVNEQHIRCLNLQERWPLNLNEASWRK